ncbi:hypothetical protein EVAR_25614_1 [Eumeta japonica]|uniref:Uncharacterized protein n=1 Tax=Eumeta variegata TaxID=151549 RepID=A0A4C1V1H0_EUMVA|nr:hypothetical protein EVAR_25614_1 [Eumeta japonica]
MVQSTQLGALAKSPPCALGRRHPDVVRHRLDRFELGVPHATIREKAKITDALNYAFKLKWRWAGHVARMIDQLRKTDYGLTSWPDPSGARKRGRPFTEWENELMKAKAKNWKIKAKGINE